MPQITSADSIMRINRSFLSKSFAAIRNTILRRPTARWPLSTSCSNEVNDGVEQARAVWVLKNIKLSYVNLIPYNPVSEHDQYSRSPKERVMAFYDHPQEKRSQLRGSSGTMERILMQPAVSCVQYHEAWSRKHWWKCSALRTTWLRRWVDC